MNDNKQILIVEDNFDIQELLLNFLQEEGYCVSAASDGVEAITVFRRMPFDLVILDIMLPKIDGYGVLELIKQESETPVILLTALDGEENQLKGYDLLADDYVTKPFSMPILLKKIAAVLRRGSNSSNNTQTSNCEQIAYLDLLLFLDEYRVFVKEREIELTHKEFEVLRELLANQGKVLSRETLLNRIWNYDFIGDARVVDTHIKNLRKKLDIGYIETIRGVGYRIDKKT